MPLDIAYQPIARYNTGTAWEYPNTLRESLFRHQRITIQAAFRHIKGLFFRTVICLCNLTHTNPTKYERTRRKMRGGGEEQRKEKKRRKEEDDNEEREKEDFTLTSLDNLLLLFLFILPETFILGVMHSMLRSLVAGDHV